ncbi:MAG: hypothetical protein K8R35_03475 [Bacteroidales bacterium]|nr:hypothetical protein [Bacteroidales bacterium]
MKRHFLRIPLLSILLFTICSITPAISETNITKLDTFDIERDARLINLQFDRTNNLIKLDNTELIEDDGPATGQPEGYELDNIEWREDLKKGIVIKKILLLDDPSAWSGQLVFKAEECENNTEPLHISLNGIEFIRLASQNACPHARQYIDLVGWDRWFFVELPVGALKKGANEILLWANSDTTSWRILIALEQEFARGSLDRPHHPNRSLKSKDGGKTWSNSELGNMNSVDGEYSLRMSLNRYVKSGEYISPIVDLIDEGSPFKRQVLLKDVSLFFDIDVPDSTKANVFVRFSSSPLCTDSSWTEWRKVATGTNVSSEENKRYFQWKAELSTLDPLKSPAIRGLTVKTEWEDISVNKDIGVTVDVVQNGHVVHSSYPFAYENLLHPGLETFRKNHKLDKIVEGAKSEFDIMIRLLNWAYRIPITCEPYSWDWNKVTSIEKGKKGMPLLQEYEKRSRDGMCLYSNQALIGAMISMGYQARHINENSEAMSGHEIMEVWSNEFNKWIYLDATLDYYFFDKNTGIPLNLLDLHNLLAEQMPRTESIDRPFVPEMGDKLAARIPVGIRKGDNPFPIVKWGRYHLKQMAHFRIIPRNDFLSNPLPVPVHTGRTMWGWNGFLNYYDEKFPKRREYQNQTDRAIDFYEPLNQSEVFLTETNKSGVLKVEVNTFTPGGFDVFLVRINDGDWVVHKNVVWQWKLKAGMNKIEIRARNVRKVLGPVSCLKVTFNP